MSKRMKASILICSLLFLLPNLSFAQDQVQMAKKFIQLLSSEQQALTLFPFDTEERYNFHFVPLMRKGITFNEMTDEQDAAALNLLKASLGVLAYQKTKEIIQLEILLKEIENRKQEDNYRDPGNYHFSIFGIPSDKSIWGWRFEGHHLSFNFSFEKNELVGAAPAFMGSNPAIVLNGANKGKQVLKDESAKGFAVLHALSASQLKKAIIDTFPYKDILSFDKRNALLKEPNGISFSELNASQQTLLLELVSLYVHRATKLFAEDKLKDIQKDGLDKIWFTWTGHTEPTLGRGCYYRIQGPGFLIEYDNTQNKANHVHSVFRDLKHDFGGDELLEHYKMTSHN